MVEDGFNVTIIWDKLMYDVENQFGKLFEEVGWYSLMTRMNISNIYNNIRQKEYMKDDNDPTSVECWYNQFPYSFF